MAGVDPQSFGTGCRALPSWPRRAAAAVAIGLGIAATIFAPGPVRAELNIDKSFGDVSGWTIGFSESVGGCLAAATYRDETTIWLGFTGRKNSAYIAFTNPKWRSIEVDGGYELQLVMRRNIWNGKFVGFERKGEKGVFSSGLKSEFVGDVARSAGVRVLLNRKEVSSLSLGGSSRALETVIECQKTYIAATAGGPTESKPQEDKPQQGGASSGTGFFVSDSGHVLTNHHVIDSCTVLKVSTVSGQEATARIIAKDKTNDLAILKTTLSPAVVPALRPQARLGEAVYVFGFPLSGILATSGNFTSGSITAVSGIGDDTRLVQISAPVQPGNSGGPLLDKFGNVVGVIVSKLNALNVAAATQDIPQNVNFAIKTAIAANFLESSNAMPADAPRSRELAPEAIADLAKLFTVRVNCD